MTAVWDASAEAIASVTFTASNSTTDNVLYRVEYSDDAEKHGLLRSVHKYSQENVAVSMEATDSLSNAPIDASIGFTAEEMTTISATPPRLAV
jgi:hypothetical protein